MFGMGNPTISPAYGRDYKSKAEVVAALNSGVDFSIGGPGGPYLSIRGLTNGTVSVRYGKLRNQVIVTIKDGKAST